ncbi:hypothetical protein [Gallaecimonas sp. GXIMD4217]|uniref:hypothetical protein n=1 Tax=Gallaecimonas sp. GXIMD4217 TaxID=3131927 RepID=UPI00311ADC3B
MNYEEIEKFIAGGCNLEGLIVQTGDEIREASKLGYEQEWLDCRLMLISSINLLLNFRACVPGETNESNSDRLILLISLIQGISYTESLISEGQYIKAAACLKQDYEIITRVNEVKIGKAKPKVTPNVKHAPAGSQRIYGELNDISHPSNINILLDLVNKFENGEVKGVSPQPKYHNEISRSLYQLHVWLLFETLREMMMLKVDLYGKDILEEVEIVKIQFLAAHKLLLQTGFEIVEEKI